MVDLQYNTTNVGLHFLRFSDKEWKRQWYLNRKGGLDMNVEEAWDLGKIMHLPIHLSA